VSHRLNAYAKVPICRTSTGERIDACVIGLQGFYGGAGTGGADRYQFPSFVERLLLGTQERVRVRLDPGRSYSSKGGT